MRTARFSLAALVATISVLCILLSIRAHRIHLRDEAIQRLERSGCNVVYAVDGTFEHGLVPGLATRAYRTLFPDDVLRIEFNSLDDARLLEELRNFRELKELDVSGTVFCDNDLVALQSFDQLAMLDLSHTRVTDGGISTLAGLSSLRSLSVAHTSVTAHGLASLAPLPELLHVEVDASQVLGEGGTANIRRLRRLRVVSLSGIDERAAAAKIRAELDVSVSN